MSAIILAISTSFPEMFVGITSALEGSPELTLGVAVGSNIANISLVAGITAVVVGKVGVHGDFLKRDVWIALVAGLLPLVLVIDGTLSRVDGLVLLSVYGAYATSFFHTQYETIAAVHNEESFFYRFVKRFNHVNGVKKKELGRLFVGLALLLFSADIIVRVAVIFGESLGISVFVIGLVILAIGTSLPELAFSLRSTEDHQPSMFFGNLLGSTIANSTLIIGTTSVIEPIVVTDTGRYLFASLAFVVIYYTFWRFIKSKNSLERKEGIVLILLYLVFLIAEFV